MFKVKLNKARWNDEEQYEGGTYNAFKLEYNNGCADYVIQVADDRLIYTSDVNCEVIEENIPTLKVKVIRARNEFEEPCVGKTYEAMKLVYPDFTDYVVQEHQGSLCGFSPDCVEVIEVDEEQKPEPTKKVLLVEDGSVNEDDLGEWCKQNGIKLIVYRQGAAKPEFLDI